MAIIKQYLQLTAAGAIYTVSSSKTPTDFPCYTIRSEDFSFRDIGHPDSAKVNPLVIEEIKVVLSDILSKTPNDINPTVPFWLEGTTVFLLNITGCTYYSGQTTAPTAYRGARGIFNLVYCNAAPAPLGKTFSKHITATNKLTVHFILTGQARTVPSDQMGVGILQTVGDSGQPTECYCGDFVELSIDDTTENLTTVNSEGVSGYVGKSTATGQIKSMGIDGQSVVNTKKYGDEGSSTKMVVYNGSNGQYTDYIHAFMSHRNGVIPQRFQVDIPTYNAGSTSNYKTVDVLPYDGLTQRMFLASPSCLPLDQTTNRMVLATTNEPVGSFFIRKSGLRTKGWHFVHFYETKQHVAGNEYECTTEGYMHTKSPGLLGGGKYANLPAFKIKMRFGMIYHVGADISGVYQVFPSFRESNPAYNYFSDGGGSTSGRVVYLKMLTEDKYIYEKYDCIVNFCMMNILSPSMVYKVSYEDGTIENATVSNLTQAGPTVNSWFKINTLGTTITAVAKPSIDEADLIPASSSEILSPAFPIGTKLVPNASNKKIAKISFIAAAAGTVGSEYPRDAYLALVLSPKTT